MGCALDDWNSWYFDTNISLLVLGNLQKAQVGLLPTTFDNKKCIGFRSSNLSAYIEAN